MTGRTRIWLSSILALCLLVIFLSPATASPLTTLRYKHTLRLAHATVVAWVYVAQAFELFGSWQSSALRDAALATRGPDLLDLTRVRLC